MMYEIEVDENEEDCYSAHEGLNKVGVHFFDFIFTTGNFVTKVS